MQVADLREQFKGREDLAEALHVLHHGKHFTTYIATAKSSGLKVLLKAYDIGELELSEVPCFPAQLARNPCQPPWRPIWVRGSALQHQAWPPWCHLCASVRALSWHLPEPLM